MAHDTIREQAAAWAVRTGDPGFEDWDRFTSWLEEDPAHSQAYDAIMPSVDEAAEALPPIVPAANDDEPRRQPRRWWAGAAAAAVFAATAVGVWQMRDGAYTIETQPGEVRLVALEGGGEIALGGDTRIVLDRDEPQIASLERGQALFTLRDDAAAPFTVTVGEDTLVDIGTVFDVRYEGERMAVAVAEGAVLFNPERQNVPIAPGQKLTSEAGSTAYRISAVPAGEIGEWRHGRLTFQDTSLGEVAADLSRTTGTRFVVAPRAAGQTVSGSVRLEPIKADPRSVGPLLGVNVRYNGSAWEIGAR